MYRFRSYALRHPGKLLISSYRARMDLVPEKVISLVPIAGTVLRHIAETRVNRQFLKYAYTNFSYYKTCLYLSTKHLFPVKKFSAAGCAGGGEGFNFTPVPTDYADHVLRTFMLSGCGRR